MTVPCVPVLPPGTMELAFLQGFFLQWKKKAVPLMSNGSYTTAHLTGNHVNSPGTYGLNFPQLTQECNKSELWKKAAT